MNYRYTLLLLLYFIITSFFSCNAHSKNAEELRVLSAQEEIYPDDCYVIDSVIDLRGKDMHLPSCGRVSFIKNGAIKNGKVYVDLNTYEIDGGYGVFSNVKLLPAVTLSNTDKSSLPAINARWFGVINSTTKDNTAALQEAIDAAHSFAIPVLIPRGYFITTSSLKLYKGDVMAGEYNGNVSLSHQKGASFIRYKGKGKSIITVEDNNVTIENLVIAADVPYITDGITLNNNSGICFCMKNVVIANAKNGVSYQMGKACGLSECLWERVTIWNCRNGIFVDINKDEGQYITYNSFYNLNISNIKGKGVSLHCGAINSTSFRDCLFANIGYGSAYDDKIQSDHFAIEALNEAEQGGITVDGGYFENIYYSKGGEPSSSKIDNSSAVFCVKNVSLTVSGVRFANTRTIVNSKGKDNIVILNCIDNGFYRSKLKESVGICSLNNQSIIHINGYSFTNENKIISSNAFDKVKIESKNVRSKNGSIMLDSK